jgi:hypothetical protein
MAARRRTAALVISAFFDDQGNPRWYARISSYRDAFSPMSSSVAVKTPDEVYDAVRNWLESVIEQPTARDDESVTKP